MGTLESKLIVSLRDMVSRPARGVSAALDRLNHRATRMNTAMAGVGGAFGGSMLRGALAVGAGYYGLSKAISGTVGASIKFEEKFADVKKVVDGTPAQLSAVRAEIIELSKRLPVTAGGIADIYAAAGQSGVGLTELAKFSEMAAKVSVAWDTSQSETGDALAKIKTQLGLGVSELGLYADAINHLSNNTASSAPDLVDYAKRVAAVGKIAGFQTTETLAFGSAMISAGAQSEVAATSFRNMAKALSKGENATKKQRMAFSTLGLDSVKTAKGMQKNALKTTLDVLERIQKLPEWQQMSIASALFGDEARGLQPVIANTQELRKELGMVADAAIYAGSASKEYATRADTTANSLQLLGNRIKAIGIEIGDGWNPFIKQAADGIGDVLISLKQRVGVLDQIKASFEGFFGGLGGIGKNGEAGGVVKVINDIGDALFGEKFNGSSKDVDERVSGLAHLSNRMREIGANFRQFGSDLSAGNLGAAMKSLGAALSEMSGGMTVGGAIAISLTGTALLKLGQGALALTFSKAGQIFIMAMAVSSLINAMKDAGSLGEFVENLSELSTMELTGIAAAFGLVGLKIWSIVGGLKAWKGAKVAASTATAGETAVAGGGLLAFLGRLSPYLAMLTLSGDKAKGGPGDLTNWRTADPNSPGFAPYWDQVTNSKGWDRNGSGGMHRGGRNSGQEDSAQPLVGMMKWFWNSLPSDLTKPIGSVTSGPSEVSVLGTPPVSIAGTPNVTITNPPLRPNISISAPITVNGITDLDMIGRHLRSKVNEAMSGIQSDMGYAAGM